MHHSLSDVVHDALFLQDSPNRQNSTRSEQKFFTDFTRESVVCGARAFALDSQVKLSMMKCGHHDGWLLYAMFCAHPKHIFPTSQNLVQILQKCFWIWWNYTYVMNLYKPRSPVIACIYILCMQKGHIWTICRIKILQSMSDGLW